MVDAKLEKRTIEQQQNSVNPSEDLMLSEKDIYLIKNHYYNVMFNILNTDEIIPMNVYYTALSMFARVLEFTDVYGEDQLLILFSCLFVAFKIEDMMQNIDKFIDRFKIKFIPNIERIEERIIAQEEFILSGLEFKLGFINPKKYLKGLLDVLNNDTKKNVNEKFEGKCMERINGLLKCLKFIQSYSIQNIVFLSFMQTCKEFNLESLTDKIFDLLSKNQSFDEHLKKAELKTMEENIKNVISSTNEAENKYQEDRCMESLNMYFLKNKNMHLLEY